MNEKEVNLLLVGKNGGCFVITKVVEFDTYLHAYYNLIDYKKWDIDDFYFRSEPYNPKFLTINSDIKTVLDSVGVKYRENSAVVYNVTYENERGMIFCDLYFIENAGKLYFKLILDRKSFILTPERFMKSFIGMKSDIDKLPNISDEEFEEAMKRILEGIPKKDS